MSILILEDNTQRLRDFRAVLDALGRTDIYLYCNAHAMLRDLLGLLSSADLISLDHDLYPAPNEDARADMGDGLMVAEWLATQCACCPVILHTSNAGQCQKMQGVLEYAGWDVRLAGAVGCNWIQTDWRVEVENILNV